jgi:hypothetical protein
MAISNLISDELYFAIRDTVPEAINGDYDSDNIDSVDVDDEKRIMTIKLSYHAMDDYAQYKKEYFDELRYGFKGWEEHYVIGYMAIWHIAFVDENRLVPCHDDALRTEARHKIDRYIADHPPVETFPRFYLVLLRQPIAPMEPDGMSRVYQM